MQEARVRVASSLTVPIVTTPGKQVLREARRRVLSAFGKKIRAIREEKGLKLSAAAADLGKDAGYLSKLETGYEDLAMPSEDLVVRIAEYYGLDADKTLVELLPGFRRIPDRLVGKIAVASSKPEPKVERAGEERPVFGFAAAGRAIEMAEDRELPTGEERVSIWPIGSARSKSAFVVIAEGDSMRPTIEPGDELLVDPDPRVKVSEGDIVLVRWEGELRVKRWNVAGGTILLTSDNPAHSPKAIVKGLFDKGHGVRWKIVQLRRAL